MTRILLSIAPLLLLMAAVVAPAQQPPTGFSTQGNWQYSSLTGPNQKRSMWSSDPHAIATWSPQITSNGPVRISFYVVAHDGNAPALLTVVHAGHRDQVPIDTQQGASTWISAGTFNFNGSGPEYVQLSRAGSGNLRAGALRMEILDPHQAGVIWQNLILDDLTPGATPGQEHAFVNFSDVGDPAAHHAAGALVGAKILTASGATAFAPNQNFSGSDLSDALFRMGKAASLSLSASSLNGQSSLRGSQFLAALVQAAQSSGKNLDWVAPSAQDPVSVAQNMGLLNFNGGSSFASLPTVDRAQAALALFQFKAMIVDSGPPANSKWRLTFDDEFNGNSVNWNLWGSDNGQLRGLSTRWPENAVVSNGVLHMVVKQEQRGAGSWTAANLWTKNFRQTYGYWEARFRYAAGAGLNNAFWMMHDLDSTKSDSFEIDVNEGHYPGDVNTTLHQNGHSDDSTLVRAGEDLSAGFHTYACLWDPQQIIFYMDGKEVSRKRHVKANDSVPAILSTAVISWAGTPHTENLNGKSMDVDWVRVYTSAQ